MNIFLYEKAPDGGINNTTKCQNVFFPRYEYIILFPTLRNALNSTQSQSLDHISLVRIQKES